MSLHVRGQRLPLDVLIPIEKGLEPQRRHLGGDGKQR